MSRSKRRTRRQFEDLVDVFIDRDPELGSEAEIERLMAIIEDLEIREAMTSNQQQHN